MSRSKNLRLATVLLAPLLLVLLALDPMTPQDPQAPPAEEAAPATTEPPAEEAPAPVGPKSPREVYRTFHELMDRYAEQKQPEDLHRAGRLFDLEDVLKGDQEYVADSAARDLLNFLDRSLRKINEFLLPSKWTEAVYSLTVPYRDAGGEIATAEVELSRSPRGIWHFSKKTRLAANDLFQAVAHLEPRSGRSGVSDSTTWLRDHVPNWMLGRKVLLQHWQWLGLLALILLGLIASTVVRLITMAIRSSVMRRRNLPTRSRGWRRSKPFGFMAMATVWFFCLQYLALPEQSHSALMLVARLFLMVGGTWAVCSLIDYATEYFAVLAERTDTRIDDVVVPLLRRALKILVVALGIVWIADNLNMDVAALLTGLSIGGLALALAARDTVENFFGTVSILADRPFEVGDWIVAEGAEGTVEEVGFRSTKIRTFYNSLITLPNALLTRAKVDNLGARVYRRVKETIGVTYDTPPDRLEAFIEGIRELILRHPYTRKDYYHVYFHSYGESSLNILLYLFLKTPDWATELRERHRFLIDILRLARELKVDFAFPTRTLHMLSAEAEQPQAQPPMGTVDEARQTGRVQARRIVESFTGEGVPGAVALSTGPRDDAVDDVSNGA